MTIDTTEHRVEDIKTNHHFGTSMYAREMLLPKGWVAKSHKHVFDHMSILASGKVVVVANKIETTYEAPAVLNIKKNINHTIYALEESVWFCIHQSDDCEADGSLDKIIIEEA